MDLRKARQSAVWLGKVRFGRTVGHIDHHLEAQLDGNPDRDKHVDTIGSTSEEVEDWIEGYTADQA